MPSSSQPARDGLRPLPRTILGYVVRFTGRHQVALAALSIAVFALSAVPLELQRRIINGIVDKGPLRTVLLLAAGYAGIAVVEQSLKLVLNIYRGWVAEDAVRRLRILLHTGIFNGPGTHPSSSDAGMEIAMMLEEAEPIGSFAGLAVSQPLLQLGILSSVVGYMIFLEPLLALVSLAFFVPQLIFVPWLQSAVNRRAQDRILTKREISSVLVESVSTVLPQLGLGKTLIRRVFDFNMSIYRLKYAMYLLMNLMHFLGVATAMALGGWLTLKGRIEVGTVVAIVGGLGKLNDPWGDLVDWGRELSVVAVKYRLFVDAVARLVGRKPASETQPMRVAT